VHRVIVININT